MRIDEAEKHLQIKWDLHGLASSSTGLNVGAVRPKSDIKDYPMICVILLVMYAQFHTVQFSLSLCAFILVQTD